MDFTEDDINFLYWFYINTDFGSVDEIVQRELQKLYEKETGRKVPAGFRYD